MHEDYFRVTSCQHNGYKYTIFTGIPLKVDSYKINSGKYIVSIRCENQSLPIKLWDANKVSSVQIKYHPYK
mgnify:CR=1 FL=1|jgi:exodeoxyribonuclease V alpha subunit|tara:strand:- start:13448 stop:13660 length:213 start_codon:yes stop_codon:yes gene_type:complete